MITVLSESRPRARLVYRCDLGCGEPIEAGERHYRQANVCDGRVDTFRAHLHCYAISAHDFDERDRLWDEDGLAQVCDIDMREWTRADIDAACDRQGWSPSHPARERARALWQRMVRAPEQHVREWGGDMRPGTALAIWRPA